MAREVRDSEDEGIKRCPWCAGDPQYTQYHDLEWGRPTTDERYLFEKLCLEGFQAGLSWLTILRKREAFRDAFAQFHMDRVARMSARDVARLMKDERIVRHRGKIESAINNAQRAIELLDSDQSLAAYIWSYAPTTRIRRRDIADVPARTDESAALARDLRRRGFTFVGPTTMYAFMQSVGVVNDHLANCHVWSECEDAQRRFNPAG